MSDEDDHTEQDGAIARTEQDLQPDRGSEQNKSRGPGWGTVKEEWQPSDESRPPGW